MKKLTSFLALCLATCVGVSAAAVEIINKAEGKIVDGVYHSLDGSYAVKVPGLGSKSVHVQDVVIAPDITYRVQFLGELGNNAAVVSTKIRKEFPKTDLVLERIASNQKAEFIREGGYLEDLQFIGQAEGKVLQAVVRYIGLGHPAQSRDGFTGQMVTRRMDVFGVHRYIIRNGYLVEFVILSPQMGPDDVFPENKLIQQAINDSTSLIADFTMEDKSDDKLIKLLKDYQPKDNYIIHKVKSPTKPKGE